MSKPLLIELPYNKDKYNYAAMTVIGIICEYEKYFLDWLFTMASENNLDPEKEESDWVLFEKIKKLNNVKEDMIFMVGDESIITSEGKCFVGVPLDFYDERYSLKRMKIETFNVLLKMKLIFEDEADLDWITVFSDVLFFEKEKVDGKKDKK